MPAKAEVKYGLYIGLGIGIGMMLLALIQLAVVRMVARRSG
jgi:hypothetical protein